MSNFNVVPPSVTVWFYNPVHETTNGLNIVNKIVAKLDPPFCHTELQFACGSACSIVMKGFVNVRKRTFDPKFYTGLIISTTPKKIENALKMAHDMNTQNVPFGIFDSQSTYCSKLVAELLIDSEIIESSSNLTQPFLLSPSALYNHLQCLNNTTSTTPTNIQAIDFK